MNIIIAILIFAFLIFFHELGHFIFAKTFGIKVNEFCIGFGPKLIGFTKGDTLYSIKALPLGGACMMEGEDEDSEDENAFGKKPLWQRALVVFGGPFFNFILAYVLAVFIIGAAGVDKPVISGIMEDYPAAEAGLMAGDEIVKLNNYPVNFYRDISVYNLINRDNEVKVVYKRDGVKNTTSLIPKYDSESGRYYMGITYQEPRESVGIVPTLGYGFLELKYQFFTTIQSLKMLVLGRLSANDLSGPVGIVKAIGDTYEETVSMGVFYTILNLVNFMVLLSANLGVMNLLPIPALDGGRLLLFLVEAVTRKKINEDLEGKIHLIGFVLLMALMIFVMFNDIRKLIF